MSINKYVILKFSLKKFDQSNFFEFNYKMCLMGLNERDSKLLTCEKTSFKINW